EGGKKTEKENSSKPSDTQKVRFVRERGFRSSVQEFLGEGGFGKVARCTKLGSPEMYAIKIITNVQEGKEEYESMKLIQVLHPDENHLMKMYECFSFQNVICLVYEILEESLEDFLIKNECKATPVTYVRALAQQMFQALKALKSIGVVHCDIKLDNIMFADKKSLKFKLIDFGLAVESKELPIGTEIQVTRFRAPEVILGLPLDESVDMWALVFASLLTLMVPSLLKLYVWPPCLCTKPRTLSHSRSGSSGSTIESHIHDYPLHHQQPQETLRK
uniref:Protein kinase domain-containing protein n=1 Tax=Oryzias latipes TaxID=8090 RepID=A0A3P9HPY7_ORYLA